MKTTFKLFLAICAVSLCTITAKAQHQISVQSGALHYFFDNVPLKTINDGGLKNLSLGLQYQYKQASQRLITAQVNIFGNYREWATETPDINVIDSRTINELNVTFSRQKKLTKHFDCNYGLGPTLRRQYFVIDTFNVNADPLNLNFYQSNQLQFGLKGQATATYTPIKWLTLYSQLNLSGYIISRNLVGNYNTEFTSDFGTKKNMNYPSRLSTSLTCGLGFNF
jgi:hypothetical protein